MTTVNASFSRDLNRVPITTYGIITTKTITYSALTTGAIGITTLFTTTGTVAVNLFGFCTVDLTGSGTVEVGTATSTAIFCNQQSATAIDNHEVWTVATIANGGPVLNQYFPINQDIIQTIASNTVTAGVLTFYAAWTPLSSDGNLVVA